jgi:dTDP-4-dehydrorhamnose reductase
MKKVLVTGANGQLGSDLRAISPLYKELEFNFTDVDELDISNRDVLDNFFKNAGVDFVINCAAYTQVDKAETDTELALLLNAVAPGYLAELSVKYRFKLIHISTDFVFDGNQNTPYSEQDEAKPIGYYGVTKLAGEKSVLQKSPASIIIRTAWLYSSFGNNFIKTMLRLGRERGFVNVVYDQIGTPTYARDLATCILHIISDPKISNFSGLFHYSNEGAISWYDLAKAIFDIRGMDCKVKPLRTIEFPTPAKRPAYSVLDKAKIKTTFGLEIPYWRDSLMECLALSF